VCIIAREVDNLPTNFGVSRTFRSRLISQHLSDVSRDLATLKVTALVGDAGLRMCIICVPSLKFVRLLVRKISRTSSFSISRPGDLDL